MVQKIIIISCHWQFNCISIFNSLYWLQQFPVVPLFGDVQIALVSYLKMCPNFEGMREKWTAAADGADDKVVDHYNLLRRMDSIREEHVKFISELARYRNEVSIVVHALIIHQETSLNIQDNYEENLFLFVTCYASTLTVIPIHHCVKIMLLSRYTWLPKGGKHNKPPPLLEILNKQPGTYSRKHRS